MGDKTDDGAHRFFGDTPGGIVPQAANLNRGACKKMENEWADWVASGRTVGYDIQIQPLGSARADSFEVSCGSADHRWLSLSRPPGNEVSTSSTSETPH